MSEKRVYTDGTTWIVATSDEELRSLVLVGDRGDADGYREMGSGERISILADDLTTETSTASEWAEVSDVGVLCSRAV